MIWYVLAWVLCSALSAPLFIWWWTRRLDFTYSEILGLIFVVAFGPVSLGAITVLCIAEVWASHMPKDKVLWPRKK